MKDDDITEMEQQLYDEFIAASKSVALQLVESAQRSGVPMPIFGMACHIAEEAVGEILKREVERDFGSVEEGVKQAREKLRKEEESLKEKSKDVVDLALVRASKNIH